MNDHTFIVWDASNKSHTWKVYYIDNTPLECECGIRISSKIRLNKLQSFFYNEYIFIPLHSNLNYKKIK